MPPSPAPDFVHTLRPRSPATTAILGVVTLGLYCIYWFIATAREMNEGDARIPSAWLLLVPIVNLWWFWRWCCGVERYTRGYLGAGTALIFLLVVPASQGFVMFEDLSRDTLIIIGLISAVIGLTCISVPILQSTLNRFRNQHIITAFE